MSMGVHYGVGSRRVIVSFEGLFDCRRVFSGEWNGLSEYLLVGSKADFCVNYYFFDRHSSLAPPLVRY